VTAPAVPQTAVGQLTAIIHDERSSLLRLSAQTRVAGAALPVLAIAAVGVLLLGGGRWLALPRVLPFVIWGAAFAAAWLLWTRRRDSDASVTSADAVAGAIEHEQQLRRGALRVAQEAATSGPLGAHAALQASRALSNAVHPRAPKAYAALRADRTRAMQWAGGALAALIAAD
jgi:hypothetical protein